MRVKLRRLPAARDLPLPGPASPGSAGLDLRAALPADAPELTIPPGERVLVPTGIALEIPPGWEGQVRPRSGLALRHGVTMINAPGTIDSDYRGEVAVPLVNLGSEPFEVRRGERIAQLVPAAVLHADFREVETLSETSRGTGGFGSTGR